jgi:hypothetical protein
MELTFVVEKDARVTSRRFCMTLGVVRTKGGWSSQEKTQRLPSPSEPRRRAALV